MKKMIILATAAIFLLSLQGAWAQREVAPPAIPPGLEGQKPLTTSETKEPKAPQKSGEEKAKPAKSKAKGKAKATPKTKSKTASAKNGNKKKAPTTAKAAKKKGSKAAAKTKKPATEPTAPATPGGPDEG
ncbi:MAG: hypothetical protein NTW80_04565 [Deltaproteobacteria bacterium]|nr:hypothetical protein [Deltaproteobacteria bacterium]